MGVAIATPCRRQEIVDWGSAGGCFATVAWRKARSPAALRLGEGHAQVNGKYLINYCGAPQLHSCEQIWCLFTCIPIAKILSIVCNCSSNFNRAGTKELQTYFKVRRPHHSRRKPQPAPFLQRLHPPQANLTKMLNDEPTMTCIVSLSAWRKNLQKQDTAGKPVKHTRSCGSWRMRNQRLKQPKPKPENSARFCVLVAAQPKC